MKRGKVDHIHRYHRIKFKSGGIGYKCDLPGCTHAIMNAQLALDRLAMCPRCAKPFVLDKRALSLANPHCYDCTHFKEREQHERIKELLKSLEGDDMAQPTKEA